MHHLLGLRQLRLGVDAAHFVFVSLDHAGAQANLADDLDSIGQVEFAFAVGIADCLDHLQCGLAVKRHHAGIAQRDLAFGLAGVGLLADRDQLVILHDQPTIAGRIIGAEAEHDQRRTLFQRFTQPREGCGRNQRRVAERHQQIVRAFVDCRAGGKHRMRRAQPLMLHKGRGIRPGAAGFSRNVLTVRPDDDGQRIAIAGGGCCQHMRQQRLPGDLVQNLRH